VKLWRVDEVMTKDVVAVREETPYRDVVDVLIGHRVSAVPVTDSASACNANTSSVCRSRTTWAAWSASSRAAIC
jgi:CBS-domain-containing membrane protein